MNRQVRQIKCIELQLSFPMVVNTHTTPPSDTCSNSRNSPNLHHPLDPTRQSEMNNSTSSHRRYSHIARSLAVLLCFVSTASSFAGLSQPRQKQPPQLPPPPPTTTKPPRRASIGFALHATGDTDTGTTTTTTTTISTRAPPRTGFAQTLLNVALNSPLWKRVLVPQARQNIVKTAEVRQELLPVATPQRITMRGSLI